MRLLILAIAILLAQSIDAQQITGVWKGKVGSGMRPRKVELKLVQKGDSLYGTSYYYEGPNNYKRFTVKGFLDHKTNGVIWWDVALVDNKSPKLKVFSPGENAWVSEADFNCPGDGRMMLDGSSRPKLKEDANLQRLHFDKVTDPVFNDEWDYVIENYTQGTNDPEIIDSIAAIAMAGQPAPPEMKVAVGAPAPDPAAIVTPEIKKPGNDAVVAIAEPVAAPRIDDTKKTPDVVVTLPKINEPAPVAAPQPTPPAPAPVVVQAPRPVATPPVVAQTPKPAAPPVVRTTPPATPPAQAPVVRTAPRPEPTPPVVKATTPATPPPAVVAVAAPQPAAPIAVPAPAPEIAAKFTEREKVVNTIIPVTADSIELHFYDNAEVDGDSISLFLNNQLIFQHIRLSDRPYVIKLSGDQLKNGNELTMVAENLGAIPPNTSYMVAFVDNKRYDATLTSSEKSSAVIRFKR